MLLSDSFATKMQRKLIALRAELDSIAATGDAAAEVVELDQSKVGRLSRMDAMQAQAMSQASGRRRAEKRKMIDRALRRIEDGTFGICRSCDQPIAQKRLEFDPTASLCIACATEEEQAGE